MELERVLTGIEGLDKLLNGGFVRNRHIILSGGPGTGKTSFCYEFLYNGAENYGEKGLFISLEQSPERVVEGAKALFDWDWDKHLGENIIFTRIRRDDFASLREIISSYVQQHGVKRVILDSLSILRLYFRDEDTYRNNLFELIEFLSELDCTSILVREAATNRREAAVYGLEEFVGDGVMNLYLIPKEADRVRVLEILKMRDTDHSSRLIPFKLTSEGIMLTPEAHMFGKVL